MRIFSAFTTKFCPFRRVNWIMLANLCRLRRRFA
jgi:hypothetical protein